jgi:hypothetical protein
MAWWRPFWYPFGSFWEKGHPWAREVGIFELDTTGCVPGLGDQRESSQVLGEVVVPMIAFPCPRLVGGVPWKADCRGIQRLGGSQEQTVYQMAVFDSHGL